MPSNNTTESYNNIASFDSIASNDMLASHDTSHSYNTSESGNNVADGNNIADGNAIDDNNISHSYNAIADGNTVDSHNVSESGNAIADWNTVESGNTVASGNLIDDGNKINDGNTIDSNNIKDSGNLDNVGNSINSNNTLTVTPPVNSDDTNSFNTTTTTVNKTFNTDWGQGSQDLEHALSHVGNSDGSLLFMPETYDLGISGGGTDSIIALDQVNSLVANDAASSISLSNSGNHLFDGNDIANGANGGVADSHVGPSGTETGASSATAGVTANLDALTQSIVLGANIQYNNFNLSVIGGNSTASASVTDDTSSHHHSGSLS